MKEEGRRGGLGTIRGEEEETETIPKEGIEVGAGGRVRGIVGEEEEEVGIEMEDITTTPRMATITTRATITGIHAHRIAFDPVASCFSFHPVG